MSLTFSIILSKGSRTSRCASWVNKIEPRARMTTMNNVLAMLMIDSATKEALVLYAAMNSKPFSAVKVADLYSSCLKFWRPGSHSLTRASLLYAGLDGFAALRKISG